MTETDSDPTISSDAADATGSTFDPAARLAHLTTGGPTGIFGRRLMAAPTPDVTPPEPAVAPVDVPATPAPVAAAAPGSTPTVGRLTRLAASEIWPDAAALASWLITDPSQLGEAIGVSLVSATAGPTVSHAIASAADGSTVSVVVEVGRTTDEALGIVVGIASIGGSDVVVWLAGEVEPTHTASLSWLNRSADALFYLVRAEGVRIGASDPAALLEAIVRPPRAGDIDPEAEASHAHAGGRRVDDHEEGG